MIITRTSTVKGTKGKGVRTHVLGGYAPDEVEAMERRAAEEPSGRQVRRNSAGQPV